MDAQHKKLLDKYIARQLELKEQKRDILSEAELQEIAEQIGLTAADLAEAKREVQSHLERGASYQQVGRMQEAEQEFVQASELDPLNPETLYQLAAFYFLFWKKEGAKKHKQQLESQIKKTLALDPKHAATVSLLAKINQTTTAKKVKKRILILLAIFVLLPALGVGTALFLDEIGFYSPPRTGVEGLKYDVPSQLEAHPKLEGIKVKVDNLRIMHPDYPDNEFYYDLAVRISSENYEVRRLALKAEFLNDKNEVVADELFWFFNASNEYERVPERFVLHPKDIAPFVFSYERDRTNAYFSKDRSEKIAKVHFKVHDVERLTPPASYPNYDNMTCRWRSQQPDYLDFSIKKREEQNIDNEQSVFHKLGLEITHTGTKPCRELFIKVNYLKNGKEIYSHQFRPITLQTPPLQPQERIIMAHDAVFWASSYEYPKPFDSYEVVIFNAD